MRILVVQESDWLEKGPHQSHHLMERMSAKGHEIRVIDFEILWRNRRAEGVFARRRIVTNVHKATNCGNVTVVRPAQIRLPLVNYLYLIWSHRKEIRMQISNFKPDVIVGFGILNSSIAERAAKRENIPFVYYLIDELHRLVPQKFLQPIARRIEKWNLRNADLVLSINAALRDYTIMMGAPDARTRIIRAGIDLTKYTSNPDGSEIRLRHKFSDSDIVMLFMGWLYEFSGLIELAAELSEDPQRYSKLKLFVIGRGDIWSQLQEIRSRPDLKDKISIVDWRPYEEIPSYLSASDVCILPARDVPIMRNIVPIKLYEYMAAGKAVISSPLPGVVREFGEGNGVLYAGSPRELLNRVLQLAEEGEIDAVGMRARKFVQANDWDSVTDEFEKTLLATIDPRSTRYPRGTS